MCLFILFFFFWQEKQTSDLKLLPSEITQSIRTKKCWDQCQGLFWLYISFRMRFLCSVNNYGQDEWQVSQIKLFKQGQEIGLYFFWGKCGNCKIVKRIKTYDLRLKEIAFLYRKWLQTFHLWTIPSSIMKSYSFPYIFFSLLLSMVCIK